jgi:hypothetical protein
MKKRKSFNRDKGGTMAVKFSALALILALALVMNVAAQEMGQGEELDYSFGVISSISGNSIVIKEYNYEIGKDIENTYILSPEAAKEENLAAGKEVDFDFTTGKDGKKTIASITVYDLEETVTEPEMFGGEE